MTRELGAHPEECHFWRTHTGAELDLLVVSDRRRLGFEFKLTDAPTLTPSMRIALRDLRLTSSQLTQRRRSRAASASRDRTAGHRQ